MRQRAFIHVDGSPGAGKTTFIERLLTMGWVSTCIRCVGPGERPRRDDLERYSRAGADCSAMFRPEGRNALEFFEIDAMQEYSQVVLIEGARPTGGLDLSVFVTSADISALSPYFWRIAKAQLVVVNILSEEQRPRAEGIVQDVIGLRTGKLPITIVIANLADPKDAGLKKALTRVKRAWTKASAG